MSWFKFLSSRAESKHGSFPRPTFDQGRIHSALELIRINTMRLCKTVATQFKLATISLNAVLDSVT